MVRILSLLLMLMASTAQAEWTQEQLHQVLSTRIEGIKFLAKNSMLLDAVKAQNGNPLTQDEILRIDAEWRAGQSPQLQTVAQSHASKYLKHMIRQMSNTYSEAFVTDMLGANVAMFPATSDFWQGDEEAFIEAYAGGKGQVHISDVSRDESTQATAVKVSVPMLDDSKVIGVLVMGVKLSAIEAQRLRDLKKQSN